MVVYNNLSRRSKTSKLFIPILIFLLLKQRRKMKIILVLHFQTR